MAHTGETRRRGTEAASAVVLRLLNTTQQGGATSDMSGHSKWANIKIRKGAQDKKRASTFTKLSKEIIVAARVGGGQIDFNPRLRMAIQKAREANVPMDNIERAIKKGTGELEGEAVEEIIYEGYGPHGVALLIEVMSDNRNRTAPELRAILGKRGGNLGEAGCVAWMFATKGMIIVPGEGVDEEELTMAALEAGAEDVKLEDGSFEITCEPAVFMDLHAAIQAAGYAMSTSEVTRIPTTTVSLDAHTAPVVLRLLEDLEDHDDVARVHANFDVPDDVLEALAGA
jgi:YebC/PmpR family DNA-binding regulatory protein